MIQQSHSPLEQDDSAKRTGEDDEEVLDVIVDEDDWGASPTTTNTNFTYADLQKKSDMLLSSFT